MSLCYDPSGLATFLLAPAHLAADCREILLSPQSPTETTVIHYLSTFACTCLFEAPIYLWAMRKLPIGRRLALAVALQAATHPFVYFFFPWLFSLMGAKFFETLLVAEIFAPLIEALILKKAARLPWAQALAYAVVANLFSWWLGVVLAV